MPALSPELRKRLEKAVVAARTVAERASADAMERLAVTHPEPWPELSAQDRELRLALRAEMKRLGATAGEGNSASDLLQEEIAYAQWHRMLFACFLSDRRLLLHPDLLVPVTLDECAQIAQGMPGQDAWIVAGEYAAAMLPGIFRPDDPLMHVRFDAAPRRDLEKLLAGLPVDIFLADDSLGWVYQFWQSQRKAEVNRSGRKIGGADLPSVTQLFTEEYMVQFLLQNTLGAWWMQAPGRSDDHRAALAGDLEYYRTPSPSAAELPSPTQPPVLGEGRQSAQADFALLTGAESSAGQECATALVPKRGPQPPNPEPPAPSGQPRFTNWPSHAKGLRILDPCCGSGHFLVAAFRWLWRMRSLEEGLSPAEAADAVLRDNLFGLEIDPRCTQIAAFALALEAWQQDGYRQLPIPNVACSGLAPGANAEQFTAVAGDDENLRAALGALHALFLLAPELGSLIDLKRAAGSGSLFEADWKSVQSSLSAALTRDEAADPAAAVFGAAAAGLARAAEILSASYHLVATNVPYLARGKQAAALRAFIEKHHADAKSDLATAFLDRSLAFLQPGGELAVVTPQNWLFLGSYRKLRERLLHAVSWEAVAWLGPRAFETIGGEVVSVAMPVLSKRRPGPGHEFLALDAQAAPTPAEKAQLLRCGPVAPLNQQQQPRNPDARVTPEGRAGGKLLGEYADGLNGTHGADAPRFRLCFWEPAGGCGDWRTLQCTVEHSTLYGGREHVFYWPDGGRLHRENKRAYVKGQRVWGMGGVSVSMMRSLPCTLYTGELFDISCAPLVPADPAHLPAIWCFCSSPEYAKAVRRIDQALKVTNASLVKVPFDLEYWQQVAKERYPDGLPKPDSDDPTQWLFHGHPARCTAPLQAAVARLMGYRWPRQRGEIERCEPVPDDGLDALADEDGIVCLPPLLGEKPAAQRLRSLLAAAYGDGWSPALEERLLLQEGAAGAGLEGWLRDGFFASHCRLFDNRPFIWQVWDGLKDGFSCLLNYHKLNGPALERLIWTYLGDWIRAQRDADERGVPGAGLRHAKAVELQRKLQAISEGDPPYDIYVRWKSLAEQPIGWAPDLNDGVRLNIRPFVNAGVLRAKFTINWNKDRGADPKANCSGTTERLNDLHFTRAEKEEAGRVAGAGSPLRR